MHENLSNLLTSSRKILIKSAKVLLLLLLFAAISGAIYEARTVALEKKKFPPPGKLYDLGGYSLHLHCTGTGSPTVILESGLCRDSLDWSWVQPGISEFTRVCSYDRAGTGWSDPGPFPRDSRHISRELHTLLEKANVPGPFVLVGHSAGGSHVQLFEHQFPEKVAGMVLVDVAHQETARPGPPKPMVAVAKFLRFTGAGRLLGFLDGKDLPPEVQPVENSLVYRPHFISTMVAENEAVPQTLEIVKEIGTPGSLGDLPLVVLTAAGPLESFARPSSMSLEDLQKELDVRHELQREMLRLSTNSRQVLARKSGHQIQKDEPELVVAVLSDLLSETAPHRDSQGTSISSPRR